MGARPLLMSATAVVVGCAASGGDPCTSSYPWVPANSPSGAWWPAGALVILVVASSCDVGPMRLIQTTGCTGEECVEMVMDPAPVPGLPRSRYQAYRLPDDAVPATYQVWSDLDLWFLTIGPANPGADPGGLFLLDAELVDRGQGESELRLKYQVDASERVGRFVRATGSGGHPVAWGGVVPDEDTFEVHAVVDKRTARALQRDGVCVESTLHDPFGNPIEVLDRECLDVAGTGAGCSTGGSPRAGWIGMLACVSMALRRRRTLPLEPGCRPRSSPRSPTGGSRR